MHRFDYRFLKDSVPAQTLGILGIVADLNAREEMRETANPKVFDLLRHSARIDSVRSSNAIEGIVTAKDRYPVLLEQNEPPVGHDEKEILGYRQALDEIYGPDLPTLSEGLIRHFHRLLFAQTSNRAGMYKREDNWIQERDARGRIHIRFVPVPAAETEEAMNQLILAWREAAQDPSIHPLLLTACFVVDFLCIHPFADGNGRVSRLLTSLLLERAGFRISRFISLDRITQEYLCGYYEALKQSSAGWHENRSSYDPFIIYLMQILYRAYKELDDRFVANQTARVPKARQIENLLLNTFVPVSKQHIAERFPDISVTTIERVLSQMLKREQIVKIGSRKDARYKVK